MKLDNPRRAMVLSPLIALLGAVAILFFLSATSDASTGGWSAPVQLTSANASDLAVDPNTGHVHVVWADGNSTKQYWYSECNPDTNSCTNPISLYANWAVAAPSGVDNPTINGITPEFNPAEALRPSVAVDSLGNVYAGFPNPAQGSSPAFFRKRPAGSTTWGKAVKLGTGWSVRLATDSSNNLHAVWGFQGKQSYKKFNSAGVLVKTLSNFVSSANGASIAIDSAGNAHLVWESAPVPHAIQYKRISAAGNQGALLTVFKASFNAINPHIAVDANDRVNITWRYSNPNSIQILYQSFNNGGTLGTPSGRKLVSIDGRGGDDPAITTVGSNPVNYFVAYSRLNPDNTLNAVVYFSTSGQLNTVDGNSRENWVRIAANPKTGELNLVYRYAPGNGSQNLFYRHQNCGCVGGPPTSTPTATLTGTVTKTPTTGPSPTRTNTPTATSTLGPPPAHGTPVNLSLDGPHTDKAPSVIINSNRDIVVAWEKDLSTSSKDIFARVALGGGAFKPAVNVTHSSLKSVQPDLFDVNGSDVYAVYQEGNDLGYSILHSGTWGPVNGLNTSGTSAQNPVGVQASDGKLWVAWRLLNTLAYDVWAWQIGGLQYKLSTSGSAAAPAIAAGANGQVFISWLDKGPKANLSNIMVKRCSVGCVALPNATTSGSQPSLAYSPANGMLYAVWLTGTSIRQSIWNGSAWGAITTVGTGTAPKTPKVFIPASGNVFVVWADSGKIYLAKNSSTKRVVSGPVGSSKDPAIYVDNNDVPYVTWQNGEVWYVANP